METAELIEKEEVINYHFVPVDQKESNITQAKLERALRLGNEYKSKTYITFLTDQGPKKIETTVWSWTEDYIQIKGSVSIPLKSLIDIA
ncbi:hypothetical protein [Moheibacter lacus]|uniref:Uncharacterized protein n=1 Tax=Moheibacter lacus TaxID=2745851 RepID=A0A838ZPC4_9FLAO|nr:hypothetical protein [Moheibacter lacus]MBA5629257.1 hypothetical protein [Moheibacter lacus]